MQVILVRRLRGLRHWRGEPARNASRTKWGSRFQSLRDLQP